MMVLVTKSRRWLELLRVLMLLFVVLDTQRTVVHAAASFISTAPSSCIHDNQCKGRTQQVLPPARRRGVAVFQKNYSFLDTRIKNATQPNLNNNDSNHHLEKNSFHKGPLLISEEEEEEETRGFNEEDVADDPYLRRPKKRSGYHEDNDDDNDGVRYKTTSTTTIGTLGDIMTPTSATVTSTTTGGGLSQGLVTTSTVPLAGRFGITHPLDRMALTANGNLQRLVSSYYDAPVEVIVDYCQKHQPPFDSNNKEQSPRSNKETKTRSSCGYSNIIQQQQPKTWDRFVRLRVHNQTFGTAHSIITVYDPTCQELVESGKVGLGQLFRYLDILPEFELHDAGPSLHSDNRNNHPQKQQQQQQLKQSSSINNNNYNSNGFWRDYSLYCPEMVCQIHEEFTNIWNISPSSQ